MATRWWPAMYDVASSDKGKSTLARIRQLVDIGGQ
ncbi:hypothetical protein PanWU01x14_013320 [Parasponia andersonii]|uniref:Uncharacterized protein n=1 Tax=Parasponia andersonii TaxID=3476 RepID=A0A2P5E113_PARAD|nr:hypothetical protein PanWU01x14_013320 [Parasponia andersonii]